MPTIAITGFPDPVIEAQARQFGAMFLLKPFTSASLLAIVEKRLRPAATSRRAGVKNGEADRRCELWPSMRGLRQCSSHHITGEFPTIRPCRGLESKFAGRALR